MRGTVDVAGVKVAVLIFDLLTELGRPGKPGGVPPQALESGWE